VKRKIIAAVGFAIGAVVCALPSVAAPTSFSITIPLMIGGHPVQARPHPATAADVRAERRLRLARYGIQLADAIVSAIGYHAYQRCLSCLAYPGGGPLGSSLFSVANLAGDRPAEVNPLIQPFSHGGFAALALGALGYDAIDARIERHWSIERREVADIAEIGAHAWGISTWLPEIKNIHRDAAIAAACGAQWQAKRYGEAFSDGCVNEYYRPSGMPLPTLPASDVIVVCAPARFKAGTNLFETAHDAIIASGTPCSGVNSPFP